MTDIDQDIAIEDVLTNQGVVTLFGEVDVKSSQKIVEFVMAHNFAFGHKLKNLTLVINSPGGSLADGFAIIDIIKNSTIPVYTVGLGQISSAGLMIFMSGSPGHRTLTPNTSIMSHQWSGEVTGKLHELLSAQTDFELTTQKMIQHYLSHSKLSQSQINKILLPPNDVFLTAEQAVKYGLADRIQT